MVDSGEAAIEALTKAQEAGSGYDVCFVDWKMPGLNGIEVSKKIRELYDDDTVVIIMSAYDLSEIESSFEQAGINMCMTKPIFQSSVFNVLMTLSGGKYTKKTANKNDFDFTGHRVLLAEDNALNQEIAIELLHMVHMEVVAVGNGREAVEKFVASEPHTYDAILMDIQMPILDGYEATKEIRVSSHPEAKTIPIFAMTANAFAEDITAALSAGMNGHIAKPIDTQILYKTLEDCILKERGERHE